MANSKYEKYIVTELKTPADFTQEYNERYATYAKRILWLDENVVEGAFQFNCSWYMAPAEIMSESHIHDTNEVVGFFGNDPQDRYNLGGEIEFWLEDEKFNLTKSCLIFIPKGMKHSPLKILHVERPIFHFSGLLSGQYIKNSIPRIQSEE